MKAVYFLLLFLPFAASACIDENDVRSAIPQRIVPPKVNFIFAPIFDSNISTNEPSANVTALLSLSKDGTVTKILKLEIFPKSLPKEPIIQSIEKARFFPKTDNSIPVEANEFDFDWEFDIRTGPKIDIDLEL